MAERPLDARQKLLPPSSRRKLAGGTDARGAAPVRASAAGYPRQHTVRRSCRKLQMHASAAGAESGSNAHAGLQGCHTCAVRAAQQPAALQAGRADRPRPCGHLPVRGATAGSKSRFATSSPGLQQALLPHSHAETHPWHATCSNPRCPRGRRTSGRWPSTAERARQAVVGASGSTPISLAAGISTCCQPPRPKLTRL